MYMIDYKGDKWDVDEGELVEYSPDDVFDLLEAASDSIKRQSKQLGEQVLHNVTAEARAELLDASKALKDIDTLWKIVQEDDAESYYLRKSDMDFANGLRSNSTAISWLCSLFLRKGTLIERTHSVELVYGVGAAVATQVEKQDAYLSIIRFHDTVCDKDNMYALNQCRREVDFINTQCRIFKCKDCGAINYIRRSDDERKLARGLQPVQRCRSCIAKRKGILSR